MRPRRGWRCALVLLLVWGGASEAAQMFVTTGRDTLRGLPGVDRFIEDWHAVQP